MRSASWALLAVTLALVAGAARAHEVRPAYLEIRAEAPGRYVVLFKQPLRAGRGLGLEPVLPASCREGERERESLGGSVRLERWRAECPAGLRGARIRVDGLARTLTDVAVRVQLADGEVIRGLLRPGAPALELATGVAGSRRGFFRLGVEHLLFGLDHVLFVLGLLYFARTPAALLRAITAFTVAHSLTLAASVLGLVQLRQAPVEAVIALSILFLAVEALREGAASRTPARSGSGQRTTLSARHTWLVAFAFGLLHGFGFAGALREIGLPRGELAGALLLFNLGVEAGQLLIVAAALALVRGVRRLAAEPPAWLARAPLHAMGALAAWWLIGRTLGMLGL